MSFGGALLRIFQQEDINFLLTNRIPRLALTRFMGWFSKLENPLVRRVSIFLWRSFCDVDLTESANAEFRSLHHAFIRRLRPNARTVDADPAVLASPCDAIVGAFGRIEHGQALQIKGMAYDIADLLGDAGDAAAIREGWYITLRLTAGMYHRFHAPLDCHIREVTYIAGDTWNLNPIALRRIEKLFCKNERAVIELDTGRQQDRLCLVAVAAILVASIRLRWLDNALDMHYRGPQKIACDASFSKGDELGYFQHGSTIILFATRNFKFHDGIATGERVKMGQALLSFTTPTTARKIHREPQPLNEVIT